MTLSSPRDQCCDDYSSELATMLGCFCISCSAPRPLPNMFLAEQLAAGTTQWSVAHGRPAAHFCAKQNKRKRGKNDITNLERTML